MKLEPFDLSRIEGDTMAIKGWAKRCVDVALALVVLVLAAPIMVAAAITIRLTSPGPVIFCQTRIGYLERQFSIFKFRTMHVDGDEDAQRTFNTRELAGDRSVGGEDQVFKFDDPRITRVGRWFRRGSIDELPQLFNILRGDMSFVGPRPSLPWEVELYSHEQRLRHLCKPGLSGLWQVSGRNRKSMLEMLAIDLDYLERRSLWLDFKILLRTPKAVLFDGGTR